MRSTPTTSSDMPGSSGARGRRMDEIDQALQIVGAGFRQHTVAEIEDVAGSAPRSPQDVARGLLDDIERRVEGHRIEIPLHSAIVSNPRPGVVERHPPVQT